ncbi:SRSO17 transposase [Bradyrhizobium sp. i1.4.4]
MNLDQGGDSETRFAGVCSRSWKRARSRGADQTAARLLHGPDGERKSVEPTAARTAPARTAAQQHWLLHFVTNAAWSDGDVLAKVRKMVLQAIEKSGPVEACIIDDTS